MQKNCCSKPSSVGQIVAVCISMLMLLLGILYYGLYRAHALPVVLVWIPGIEQLSAGIRIPTWLTGASLPSLVHAFATVLMLKVVLRWTAMARVPVQLIVLLALFGFEVSIGFFDWLDVLAIMVGAVLAEIVAAFLGLSGNRVLPAKNATRSVGLGTLITVSGLLAAGSNFDYGSTSECSVYDNSGTCIEYKRRAVPVYMSYQRLRDAVGVEPPRSPDRIGRLYLYGDYVFLNEKNEGIHVIDNQDPAVPVNVGFIRVPGNTELAIRGNYLYADSYVDLVTLDLNDLNNVHLVDRQVDIFPYDAFQNIPNNISFSGSDINIRDGVVVSYKAVGSRP